MVAFTGEVADTGLRTGVFKVAGDAGPEVVPGASGLDTATPNGARIYDYLLGGKDNYAADRRAAELILKALPDAALVARANRAFMAAAVRQVAGFGVSQFIDIGTGLPTPPSVHKCARSVIPDARVAYVDNDPVVIAHSRALLATDDLLTVIDGDARHSKSILTDPQFDALIDLSRPVCVMFVGVLEFVTPAQADDAVATFRDAMAPGSYLVISTGHGNERSIPVEEQIQAAYGGKMTLTGRPAAEVAAYFGDFELIPPGLVPVTDWPGVRPDAPSAPTKAEMLVGIGRKPG
jgi:S-adenosyl methyltransferase